MLKQIQEKPIWTLASLLSIIYAVVFALVLNDKIPNIKLLYGFCVWGHYSGNDPDLIGTYPEPEVNSCDDFPVNSHYSAFIADAIMTGMVVIFYWMDRNEDKNKIKVVLTYVANGFIIFAHGVLHWGLYKILNCYVEDTSDYEKFGYLFFGIFSFFLCLIIVSVGFPEIRVIALLVISVVFSLVVAQLSSAIGGEYVLPALFVIVQPVACITGLFSKQRSFTPTVGKLFTLSTVVGILELSLCVPILRPLGGHIWYDITLHAAVLAALPYFTNTSNSKEKKRA